MRLHPWSRLVDRRFFASSAARARSGRTPRSSSALQLHAIRSRRAVKPSVLMGLYVDEGVLMTDELQKAPRIDVDAMRQRVHAVMPVVREALERLVAIPSVAFGGYPREPVEEAAQTVSLIHISEPTRLGMTSYAVF